MFAWFDAKPECPVDAATKDWIDRRWAWLTQEFGPQRLRDATVVLPLAEYFPDEFDGRPEDAQRMLDRVCEYMGIDPTSLALSIYYENNPVFEGQWQQGTSGLYQQDGEQHHIWIEQSNLADPVGMIGTMAHEIGHVHLLGHGRISDETPDHEPLTDLLTVFLGLGVFTANSVIYEQYLRQGAYARERMGKRGYLTMPQFAYALALFARDRGEEQPVWANHLRPDVRVPFANACRFLAAPPEEIAPPAPQPASTDIQALAEEELLHSDDELPEQRKLPAIELARRLAAGERDFRGVDLHGEDLQGLNLEGCNLREANLTGANLCAAKLGDADLRRVDAQGALFTNASMRGADLRDGDFGGADLTDADLTEADIRAADFQDATLLRAVLLKTVRSESTDFTTADLSEAVTDIDMNREQLQGLNYAQRWQAAMLRFFRWWFILWLLVIALGCGGAIGGWVDWALDSYPYRNANGGLGAIIGSLTVAGLFLWYHFRHWSRDNDDR